MKTIVTLLIGALLGIAALVGVYLFFADRESKEEIIRLTFTEEEVQEKLARKFPREEKLLGLISFVIEAPTVRFLGNDNRLQLATRATVTIPFVGEEEIRGTFSSSIRYNQEDHTLRTADYQVEDIGTDRLPKKYEGPIRTAMTVAARELLDDEVIHTVKDKDVEGKLTRFFLQELKVKKGHLEVILGL